MYRWFSESMSGRTSCKYQLHWLRMESKLDISWAGWENIFLIQFFSRLESSEDFDDTLLIYDVSSTDINRYQQVSTDINRYQQVSKSKWWLNVEKHRNILLLIEKTCDEFSLTFADQFFLSSNPSLLLSVISPSLLFLLFFLSLITLLFSLSSYLCSLFERVGRKNCWTQFVVKIKFKGRESLTLSVNGFNLYQQTKPMKKNRNTFREKNRNIFREKNRSTFQNVNEIQ